MKSFNYNLQIQVYMYALMYVNTVKMEEEDYIPDTKIFFENYNNMSTPGTVPKHWLGFSYIRPIFYELYLNFDETKILVPSRYVHFSL